ncbi:MAG: hypothetical protein ACFBWO_07690 [Paracoccaceae bacterium]
MTLPAGRAPPIRSLPARDLARAFAERHRGRLAYAAAARCGVAARWRVRAGESWRRAALGEVLALVAGFAREASEGAAPHVVGKMRSPVYAARAERHARHALTVDPAEARADPRLAPHMPPRGRGRPARA